MRRFLAALVITGLCPAALFAQARPDSLVKPAVRYSYPNFQIDSTTFGADSIARADSAAVADVIRKHLGARKHEITGVRLFSRDSASVRAKAGGTSILYRLDRQSGLWVKRDREEHTIYKRGHPYEPGAQVPKKRFPIVRRPSDERRPALTGIPGRRRWGPSPAACGWSR